MDTNIRIRGHGSAPAKSSANQTLPYHPLHEPFRRIFRPLFFEFPIFRLSCKRYGYGIYLQVSVIGRHNNWSTLFLFWNSPQSHQCDKLNVDTENTCYFVPLRYDCLRTHYFYFHVGTQVPTCSRHPTLTVPTQVVNFRETTLQFSGFQRLTVHGQPLLDLPHTRVIRFSRAQVESMIIIVPYDQSFYL